MTIGRIADQLAQVFVQTTYATSPTIAKDRILVDLNAAIQQMQDAGEDFYGRTELEVDLVPGQEVYTLDKDVQTVLRPAKLSSGQVLTEILSRGALHRFGNIFLDQLSPTVSSARPTHYFVESTHDDTSDSADDVNIDVHLLPTPTSAVAGTATLILDVIKEPELFDAADLVAGTALVPIPHKYVESIFLPLARYNAMGSYLFFDKDKVPHIEDDYIRALQLLGKADPRRPKPDDSDSRAMQIRKSRQPQGPEQT